MGICNFAGASVIFGSVCEMYCTKKITPGKNFSFSLHEQDQGARHGKNPEGDILVLNPDVYFTGGSLQGGR